MNILAIAGPPVEVGVTMYVLSISSVSEVLMVLVNDINVSYKHTCCKVIMDPGRARYIVRQVSKHCRYHSYQEVCEYGTL